MSGNHKNSQRILDLIVEGHSSAVIASKIGLKVKGVKYHLTKLYKAHNVTSRAQLIRLLNDSEYNIKVVAIKNRTDREKEMMQSEINRLTQEVARYKLIVESMKALGLPTGR